MAALSVQRDDVVVDIGSGAGNITVELARRARLAVAVERDRASFGDLRRAVDFGAGLAACEADALRLPFRDASVDKVLLSGTLHALDPEPALADCRRVLKPRGTIVVTVLVAHPMMRRALSGRGASLAGHVAARLGLPGSYDAFREAFARRYGVLNDFDPDRLEALMRRQGFELLAGRHVPSGAASALIEWRYLLGWRGSIPAKQHLVFAVWYPVLRLLQRVSRTTEGLEWVATFRAISGAER
jgi:ubiquinone/menaquinone biosynthesis C-methylase UbiE